MLTGWYSEFGALDPRSRERSRTAPAATFRRRDVRTDEPLPRGAVFRFFADKRLDAPFLRDVSQHQIGVLADTFDALGVDPAVIDRDRSTPRSEIAGFGVLNVRPPRRSYRSSGRGAFSPMRAATCCASVPRRIFPIYSCATRWECWARWRETFIHRR